MPPKTPKKRAPVFSVTDEDEIDLQTRIPSEYAANPTALSLFLDIERNRIVQAKKEAHEEAERVKRNAAAAARRLAAKRDSGRVNSPAAGVSRKKTNTTAEPTPKPIQNKMDPSISKLADRHQLALESKGLWRVMSKEQIEQRRCVCAGYLGFKDTKSMKTVMFRQDLLSISLSWLKLRMVSFNLTCPEKDASQKMRRSSVLSYIHHNHPSVLTLDDIRNAPTCDLYTTADFDRSYLLMAHFQLQLIEHPDLRDSFEYDGGGAASSGNTLSAFGISMEDWHRALIWLLSFAYQFRRAKISLKRAIAIEKQAREDPGEDLGNADDIDEVVKYMIDTRYQNAYNTGVTLPVFWTDRDRDAVVSVPAEQNMAMAVDLEDNDSDPDIADRHNLEDNAENRSADTGNPEKRCAKSADMLFKLMETEANSTEAVSERPTPESSRSMLEWLAGQAPFLASRSSLETTEQDDQVDAGKRAHVDTDEGEDRQGEAVASASFQLPKRRKVREEL